MHAWATLVLADVASLEDAIAVEAAGVDAVHRRNPGLRNFSWPLLEALVEHLHIPVIAEGHISQPEEVRRTLEVGAYAVW